MIRARFLFFIVFLSFVTRAPIAEAKLLPPAPRVYINTMLDSTCADGSRIRARLNEQQAILVLDREGCRQNFIRIATTTLPKGGNALETDFLVYGGRLFEDVYSSNAQPAILFCRTETSEKLSGHRIKVVVRQASHGSGYILSLSVAPSYNWTAVETKLEGKKYSGKGNINPDEYISLSLNPAGTRAKVEYMFEVGAGSIGKRPQARGSVSNLQCYRP
jgi:hypothetical protein